MVFHVVYPEETMTGITRRIDSLLRRACNRKLLMANALKPCGFLCCCFRPAGPPEDSRWRKPWTSRGNYMEEYSSPALPPRSGVRDWRKCVMRNIQAGGGARHARNHRNNAIRIERAGGAPETPGEARAGMPGHCRGGFARTFGAHESFTVLTWGFRSFLTAPPANLLRHSVAEDGPG